MKFGEITRYDNYADGRHERRTIVTPLEMLEAILRAVANGDSEDPRITVMYRPSDDEERARINEKLGHDIFGDSPRLPGRHVVDLWHSSYDDEDGYMKNDNYATFIFTTDPEDSFFDPNCMNPGWRPE